MKKFMNEKNYYLAGIVLYIFFSISIFFGLLINEDASGKGTSNDFKNTWEYVLLLKENYFIDSSEWTRLLPFHYIFLSILYELLEVIFSKSIILHFFPIHTFHFL